MFYPKRYREKCRPDGAFTFGLSLFRELTRTATKMPLLRSFCFSISNTIVFFLPFVLTFCFPKPPLRGEVWRGLLIHRRIIFPLYGHQISSSVDNLHRIYRCERTGIVVARMDIHNHIRIKHGSHIFGRKS